MDALLKAGYKAEYTIIARQLYRVDFAHPKLKDIVEFDGPYHSASVRPGVDSARDRNLARAGWKVTRIPYGK